MDVKKKRELRNLINKLKKIRGRHTELVSVYIPANYNITKIINHLSEEQHNATNIKDKRTRQNVQDSLERIIRRLKLYKKTPENGLAIFAGNISEKESQIDIEIFSIDPPEPLNIRMYRCDQSFVVDILEDMMDVENAWQILKDIDDKKIKVEEVHTFIPSPFSLNLVLQGYSEILKMEDKQKFLQRMHYMVKAKIALKNK